MKDYIKSVLQTESNDYERIKHRIGTRKQVRLLHGVMGLSTEAGELLDALKKSIFYGKPLDEINLKEEIGDCLWYIALLLDELNSSFNEVEQINIAKLFKRYGITFNEDGALNRDLQAERYILEKNPTKDKEDLDSIIKEIQDAKDNNNN